MNCNKPIKTQYLGEVQIDTLESLPDYIIAERDVTDPATGNVVRSLVRVPARKLFPTANMDNVFALDPNNTAIEIPERQVRAVRVVNEVSATVMQYADETHPATMIAVGKAADMILCMSSGAINIPEGHDYTIGLQYYVGENGEPVTDDTSGQKLFIPVSPQKLVINM